MALVKQHYSLHYRFAFMVITPLVVSATKRKEAAGHAASLYLGGMSEEFFDHAKNFIEGLSGHSPGQKGFSHKFRGKITFTELRRALASWLRKRA